MATEKTYESGGVIDMREARDCEKRVEEGILDTVQSLTDKKIRRRDRILNMAWYRFLIIMLCIGGSATLQEIYQRGYQNGQSSTNPVQVQAPVINQSQPALAPEQGMTTATVKVALAETESIISSADKIAEMMRPSEITIPVIEESPVPSPTPAAAKQQVVVELPKSEAELANERLRQRLHRQYGIQ